MTDTPIRTDRLLAALRILGWGGAAALLLTPAIAMQFSDEVQWTASDFVIAGFMLSIPLAIMELTLRASRSWAYRGGVALAAGTALVITWVNLAVGIIGDEGDPQNLMFFGVIGVAIVGGALGRFRPKAMALALLATAVAQLATAGMAYVFGHVTFVLISAFALGWLLSAGLFWKAAGERA